MYILFVLACIPIVWLMISLGKLKIAGHKACPIAFLITLLLAIFIWNMNIIDAFTSTLEGVALWPIMLVIVAAVFTYNLSIHTGIMDIIKRL